jgi:hypothetical protein
MIARISASRVAARFLAALDDKVQVINRDTGRKVWVKPETLKGPNKVKYEPIKDSDGDEEDGGEEEKKRYRDLSDELIATAQKNAPNTEWLKPDVMEEKHEIDRTAEALKIDRKVLRKIVRKIVKESDLETLDDKTWKMMKNSDSWESNTVDEANGRAYDYDRDIASVFEGMGKKLPAPIVLMHDGTPYLIAGNTRLMASRALKVRPKVLMVRV